MRVTQRVIRSFIPKSENALTGEMEISGVVPFSRPCTLTRATVDGIGDREAQNCPPAFASALAVGTAIPTCTTPCADSSIVSLRR
jgi:hypothetical protein